MKIVKFSTRRPVTITMVMMAAIIFGIVAFQRLSIDLLPDITYPTLTIRTEYPGTAPAEIERLISAPIEESVGVVSGVVRTSSISRPGLSEVIVEFAWGTNMDFASLDVREKLDLLNLPRDAEKPILLRFDPSLDPIMRIGVHGEESLVGLRLLAEERLKQELESIEGVASVKVSGGLEEEIHIDLNEPKLAQLRIPITQVTARLAQENINLAGGTLKEGNAEYLVRTLNEFQNVDEIGDIVIGMRNGVPVYLKDVTDKIYKGHKERTVITHINGQESVEVAVFKEADQNTVAVAGRVKEKLAQLQKEFEKYSGSIKMTIVADQSTFIQQSVDEVLNTALIGGILAVLVLYFFLRSLKSTAIIGLAIPISVVTTFFLMYVSGVNLNIMSLGGLALGIGMLVDNAIVVLEAIDRHRQRGLPALEAADTGASEVGRAVVASTLTTVCVFLPIIFVQGIAGQLFTDQALTVTYSLLASLGVALTLIPMLAAVDVNLKSEDDVLQAGDATTGGLRQALRNAVVFGPALVVRGVMVAARYLGLVLRTLLWPFYYAFEAVISRVYDVYPAVLTWALRYRARLIGAAVALFVASVLGFKLLGSELIPEMSQGEFYVDVKLPVGTPVEQTDRIILQMGEYASRLPYVERVYTVAGSAAQYGFSSTEERENLGQIHVMLEPGARGAREQRVMDNLRQRYSEIPGIEYKFSRPTLFSFRTPIEVEIRGYNLNLLQSLAETLADRMRHIRGLRDVKATTEGGNPEVRITFNRRRLASLGLDVSTVGTIIRNKVQGDIATQFTRRDRRIDIRVRAREQDRSTLQDLERLIINPQGDVPIPLAAVADVNLERGPSEIRHANLQRVALVSASLSGRDLGSVTRDIQQAVDQLILPEDFTVTIGGQRQEMAVSFKSMLLAIGLAVFLVYLVMASQFESLLHPFVIMFTIPLGLIGVVAVLLLTHQTINVVVLIGMVLLSGIVVNNAIVLVDYINQLRRGGMKKMAAIQEAGKVRLRPILMTTSTTVLGLLPMALGFGEGAEVRAPLAITVIGGLIVGTVLTLVVVPTVYSVLAPGE